MTSDEWQGLHGVCELCGAEYPALDTVPNALDDIAEWATEHYATNHKDDDE